MSVKNFYKDIETMSEKEALTYLQTIADEMKERIIHTESDYFVTGRVIYVSADGDDANDGLSPEHPIATLNRVHQMMQAKDTFLFRRGDMFRGRLIIEAEADHVTLSAYGEGKKPVINSSLRDYADEACWLPTDYPNVWVCANKFENVGIVHYDTKHTYGEYEEKAGYLMVLGREKDFTGPADLKEEYTFYSDLEAHLLYLYSPENPGKRYSSLEIGDRGDTIRTRAAHLTVDNLHIQHTGSHGVAGCGECLTVKNCVFDWLGGSILTGFAGGNLVRYGNAVEVGGCNGYLVKNNWIYQIYDTGITHQAGPQSKCDVHQYNVLYLDNLIEYCYWSLEFYNGQNEFDRVIRNVYITGNFCRFGGFGWGCRGRESSAPMFSSGYCCDNTQDFCAENNIFDRCLGVQVYLGTDKGNKRIRFRSNAYIQKKDARFLYCYGESKYFDDNVRKTIVDTIGDDTATILTLSDWFVR